MTGEGWSDSLSIAGIGDTGCDGSTCVDDSFSTGVGEGVPSLLFSCVVVGDD